VREGLARAVAGRGHRTLSAPSLAAAREIIDREPVDCVLLDIRLKDGDGLELLREMRARPHSDTPVLMATAHGGRERTIEAMKAGAFEYVTKPFDLPVLLEAVERAVRQRALARSARASEPPTPPAGGPLVGVSAPMLAVWKVIGRAAASDAPVLVTGET